MSEINNPMDSNNTSTAERLYNQTLLQVLGSNDNRYATQETLINRVLRSLMCISGLSKMPEWIDSTSDFQKFHTEIQNEYDSMKERIEIANQYTVEHVLSTDTPCPAGLARFSMFWHQITPKNAVRLFAVDGFLGDHPKEYVMEAFSPEFRKHNDAIRELYKHVDSPPEIMSVLLEAFEEINRSEYSQMYTRMVGKEMLIKMRDLRFGRRDGGKRRERRRDDREREKVNP